MSDQLSPADVLGHDGLIARRLPNYELRPQQLEMADAVANALNGPAHLMVEAGTGVGKSFAYLVPAILAVTAGDAKAKKIVVSTHTISLQEQILSKDIPFLNSVIPREFTTVLVKGRGNYLSLRRLKTARERAQSLFTTTEATDDLRAITKWSTQHHTGSRSDLQFRPDPAVWDEVASDSGNCMSQKCPTYQDCFYYRARRRVYNAQILIVNHALFFSDLALRQMDFSILPDYDAVIFDEAHTLHQVAGKHFGLRLTEGQIIYNLNRLYNDQTNRGLLVHHHLQGAEQLVDECRHLADEFFDDLREWSQAQSDPSPRVAEPHVVAEKLTAGLEELAKVVRAARGTVQSPEESHDFAAAAKRLDALRESIQTWLEQSLADTVYWVEETRSGQRRSRLVLEAAPVDVGPSLREHLFNQVDSVILTSATLSVGREPNFDFFQSRIGVTQTNSLRLGSPFDYRRQAKLILVKDMPEPSVEPETYQRLCATMIQRYVARTDGHAFVLFTSYAMLRQTAQQIRRWLADHNLALYSQAEGLPRHLMVEKFKQNPRAVLLGTDSFWQGVDVPGDALQNVIITRLPFSVPTHPLMAAQLESVRAAGGNPFHDFQVPEAIIKLRQGFGRLIRTQEDRGMVVVLDSRIRTKPYGRLFVESLPDCEVIEESITQDELGPIG
ncbi:MAG: DEAD/DEAH box helicase [Planctomycetales bacterium]|nr:DEAD/DEAH box helicase [Planctomycetales bacterium]